MAVSEKIGREEALKILAKEEWKYGRNWIKENMKKLDVEGEDAKAGWTIIQAAYKLTSPGSIVPKEHELVRFDSNIVTIRRTAWCPILEACEALKIPTKEVCPNFTIQREDAMLKTLNPKLSLRIGKIRPESPYCEYIIELQE